MKKMTIALGLSAMSFFGVAQTVDVETLKGYTIQPVEQLQQQGVQLELNGRVYKKLSGSADSVKNGDVLYSLNGLDEFVVSGEIVVKLENAMDFEKFSQQNDVTIKQAYENFYILQTSDKANLLNVVGNLQAIPTVRSVTIDLVDKNVQQF